MSEYKLAYAVNDPLTGDVKEQQEAKDCDGVTGYYKTLDTDGMMRTVNYRAHPLTGFNADVVREPVGMPIVNPSPILRAAEIEPARIMAAPMLETRIAAETPVVAAAAAAAPLWRSEPLVETKQASAVVHPAPVLRAELAAAPIAAAPIWRSQPLVETKQASSIVHPAPLLRADFAAAPIAAAAAPIFRSEPLVETKQASAVVHPAAGKFLHAELAAEPIAAVAPQIVRAEPLLATKQATAVVHSAAPVPILRSDFAAAAPLWKAEAAPIATKIISPSMAFDHLTLDGSAYRSFDNRLMTTKLAAEPMAIADLEC